MMERTQRLRVLQTAIEVLSEQTETAQGTIEDALNHDTDLDGDVIDELDSAINIVLEARNAYCQEIGMCTEDATINFTKSDAQIADEEEQERERAETAAKAAAAQKEAEATKPPKGEKKA